MIGGWYDTKKMAPYDVTFREKIYEVFGCKNVDDFFHQFPLLYCENIHCNDIKGEILVYRSLGIPHRIKQSEIDFFNGKTTVIEQGKLNLILSESVWRVKTARISVSDEFMINTISSIYRSRQVGLVKIFGNKIELEGVFKKFDHLSCMEKAKVLFDFMKNSQCTIEGEEFYSGKLLVRELKDEQFQKRLNNFVLRDINFSFVTF